MPSSSKKQHNLMAAVANNPKFAKKVGIPKKVGEEFMKADKGRKFSRGGEMAMKPMKQLKAAQKDVRKSLKADTAAQRKSMLKAQAGVRKDTRAGNVSARRQLRSSLGESGAKNKEIRQAMQGLRKEQSGGMRTLRGDQSAARKDLKASYKSGMQDLRGTQQAARQELRKPSAPEDAPVAGMKKGGMACSKTMKYAKGGAIDGCAKKGKTRGKMI